MSLPERIKSLIIQEQKRSDQTDEYMRMIRRKGQHLVQEDPYTLASEPQAKQLLADWNAFHSAFSYPSFSAFYSKRNFCNIIRPEFFLKNENLSLFLMLLADRKFLFLEFNEHANHPDYPPLSEIVRAPKYYCADTNGSDKAYNDMIRNAAIVQDQGFIPTNGHVQGYEEMKENLEEIHSVLDQRKQHLKAFHTDFASLQVNVKTSAENFSGLDMTLSSLFKSYVTACATQGYKQDYSQLLGQEGTPWLGAIHALRTYLDAHPEFPSEHALIFFNFFSQNTIKLLEGKIRTFTFHPPRRNNFSAPKQAQITARQKIYCNIMLFDHLLKLLPPKDGDVEGAKYQFHRFTHYDKYPHFTLPDKSNSEFSFDGVPDYKHGVDQVGSLIRYHIFYCIPNYVTWLTPALPSQWSVNSATLATLLLQDAAKMPTRDRLTDKIRLLLNDVNVGPSLLKEYLSVCNDQRAVIERLDHWCIQYGLEFTGEDTHEDMQFLSNRTKSLCSRFVLEHALKERALSEPRERLSKTATSLLAEYLVEGESFML